MLLTKEIVVYLNLAECKVKQQTASLLRKNGINLTPEQFLALDMLWNQGPMSQKALSDAMHKDKNSITKLVDALETKGLVRRNRDKEDRRSNTIVPTAKAEQMKEATKQFGVNMLEGILEHINEQEQRCFLSTLKKIIGD